MTNPKELFEAARKQSPNPFRLKPIVSADEVWGDVITDLSELNQHVDQKIYQAISEVRQEYSSKIGIAINGDRGTGKSHTISRIWKTIEHQGNAIFAYIPPFANPNLIDPHVRDYLSQSLKNTDVNGITQWQRLAAAMINTLKGTGFEEEYQQYVDKCNHPEELRKCIISTQSKNTLLQFFDDLAEAIIENQPKLDYDFLKAVLFLLLKAPKLAQIGMAWIQGKEHPEARKAGLPEFSAEEQQAKSIWFIEQICQLAKVASLPVIVCFDQLDSAKPSVDCGDSPAETVAKCIDRIYLQCSNIILLCCVISDTLREIEQMGSGIPDRVTQWSVAAKPPTAEQILKLVQLRLDWFYQQNKLQPNDYHFLYPFDEREIRNLASKAAGVRALMIWCADQFDSIKLEDLSTSTEAKQPKAISEEDKERKEREEFLGYYKELLAKSTRFQKNDDDLAEVISLAMKMIPNEGTANVVIKEVKTFDNPNFDLHLIIYGYDSLKKQEVKIRVRVCETTTAKTFIAVMNRVVNYKDYQTTRGCLVRSTPIPKSWKVGHKLKEQLEKQQGGEVVEFKKDEIKSLVALNTLYKEAENYGFTKKKVEQLVKELRLAADNTLVMEILSAPM